MRARELVLAIGLVLLWSAPLLAETTLTPAQGVFQWLQWYPQDLPKAASLTTTKMRDGLSPKHWVVKNALLHKDLQFINDLEWKIREEDRDEVVASVSVQARFYLGIGEVRQVETYILKKVKGHWRIDRQTIQGDRVIGRTI